MGAEAPPVAGFLCLPLNQLTKRHMANNNDDYQRMTPLHYLVGGIAGVLIYRLIYGEVTFIGGVISFIGWPLMFIWGAIIGISNLIG